MSRKIFILLIVIAGLVLTACGSKTPTPTPTATITPTSTPTPTPTTSEMEVVDAPIPTKVYFQWVWDDNDQRWEGEPIEVGIPEIIHVNYWESLTSEVFWDSWDNTWYSKTRPPEIVRMKAKGFEHCRHGEKEMLYCSYGNASVGIGENFLNVTFKETVLPDEFDATVELYRWLGGEEDFPQEVVPNHLYRLPLPHDSNPLFP